MWASFYYSLWIFSVVSSGFTFGTFVVEQKYYMKYLSDKLVSKGVLFVQERVESVDSLVRTGKFDCVVNCTGLGALQAAADPSMYPIRGQVLRVRLAGPFRSKRS